MVAPVILVEATPRRATDGVAVTVRLAGGGGELPYFYGGQHWRAGLAGLPNTIASLDFDGEQLGGGGVPQAMELRWSPGSSAALDELQALYWTDAPVTVRTGPEGAMPPIDVAGLVLDAAMDGGTLALPLSDQAADLRRAVLVARFAGTGGIEGPAEWADLIKPRCWGRCFNVPGRLLDRANQIWCFGDPARAWQAFDEVRDKGVAPETAAITVLAWQGSIAATFAALQAAAAPSGGGVACPSIACVKWWAEPAGDLRADVRGETDGGYAETAPQIAERIVAARSAIPFGAGAVAAAAAVRPAPCGWRIDSDSATAIEAISDLLAGVSLSWVLVDGAIEFRRWEWTAPTRAARSERLARRRTFKPVTARKLGYRRNWSPMARGDLADLVLVQDVVYDDGTPIGDAIEDAATTAYWSGVQDDNGARPKNYADVTASNTAAAIFGQGAFATISSAAYGSPLLTGFGALSPLSALNLGTMFLRRADGTTSLTEAMAITALGTAMAIANQGAFATTNSAAYGSSLLTGFGALSPLSSISLGSNFIRRADGSTTVTETSVVTAQGVALGIANQGAGATANTLSQLDGAAAIKLTGIEANANRTGPDRAINLNSDFSLADVDPPRGWQFNRANLTGPVKLLLNNPNSTRGSNVLECQPASLSETGWIPVQGGESIWIEYRVVPTANRAGDVPATYHMEIGFAASDQAMYASSAAIVFSLTRTIAQGVLAGKLRVTVPAAERVARASFAMDASQPGSAARCVIDYLAISRDEPGSTLGADVASNVRDGETALTRDKLITGLGVASAIVDQGVGATANSLLQLDVAAGLKLGGIAPGATVGATWGNAPAARYWRISTGSNGRSYLSFVEIEMRAESDGGGADLTTGKAYVTSSVLGGSDVGVSYGASPAAIDDNPATGFHSQAGSAHWFCVDFGAATTVQHLTLTSKPNETERKDAPLDMTVDYSDDQITWTGVYNNPSIPLWGNSEKRSFSFPQGTSNNVVGRPTSLTQLSPTEGTKLTNIQAGATLGADVASNMRDGTTLLTRGQLITGLGTASAIANQADWATYTGISTGGMAGRVTNLAPSGNFASFANITERKITQTMRADGSTSVTEAMVVTNQGVAVSITGQADWATYTGISTGGMAGRVTNLAPSGNFASFANITERKITQTTRADGSTSVTESMVVTNQGVAASITGQGWAATQNEGATSNAKVALGANSVMNSSFARGAYGYRINPTFTIQMNYTGYYGRRQVAYVSANTTFGGSNGQTFDISSFGWWGTASLVEQSRYSMPVTPGDRLGARILAGRHRLAAQLWILVFNKDGTLIQGWNGGLVGTDLGGYQGEFGASLELIQDVTHPDAAFAQWMLRGLSTGEGASDPPYLFFSEPWFGKLAKNSTVIPDFTNGPADPLSDQTSANVASSITGQGQLATIDQVGAGNLAASAVMSVNYRVLADPIVIPRT